MDRRAKVSRKTSEVEVTVDINLDGKGKFDIETGIPFFNHMLSQFAKHGYFDLTLKAKGDIEVDFHHTVEDVGLTLGEAFLKALGDKRGISRFGEALVSLIQIGFLMSKRSWIFQVSFTSSSTVSTRK